MPRVRRLGFCWRANGCRKGANDTAGSCDDACMVEVSGDELFALLVSGVVALTTWVRVVLNVNALRLRPRKATSVDAALLGLPAVAAIALLAMLMSWADAAVRTSAVYLFFYLVLGLAWVGMALWMFGWFGISLRDDALERNNVAAAIALYGGCVAVTLAFAGGNFGDGPGWWVVVFSAGLGTLSLAALWIAFNRLTWIVDRIVIDRDAGAALHVSLLCIAWGVIAMRSAAGDWQSAQQTIIDFAPGWLPMLGLFAFGTVVERRLRPLRAPGPRTWSVSIAAGLSELGAAIAWVVWRGWW